MFETTGTGVVFLLARVVFGGVLAFTGLNHFMDVEGMAGYAEFKGLPAPKLSVLGSGGLLVFQRSAPARLRCFYSSLRS